MAACRRKPDCASVAGQGSGEFKHRQVPYSARGLQLRAGAMEKGCVPVRRTDIALALGQERAQRTIAEADYVRVCGNAPERPCLACSIASISPYSAVSLLMEIISRPMQPAITRINGIIIGLRAYVELRK